MRESLDAFQLGPFGSAARASSKPSQLRLAAACGLDVPRTLVSNDPDVVRDFAGRVGPLVAKMLVQPSPPAGEQAVVFTSEVIGSDLADLEGLRVCPMTFQERIDKAAELRVAVAGRQLFAAGLAAGRRPLARRASRARRGASWQRCACRGPAQPSHPRVRARRLSGLLI